MRYARISFNKNERKNGSYLPLRNSRHPVLQHIITLHIILLDGIYFCVDKSRQPIVLLRNR